MQRLSRDSLPLGGFAGLKEHRLVTDSRVFGRHKRPYTSEGLDNFVYLADARFNPKGETGMHPHHEIDVISVMVEGRVHHEGSLEHGKGLEEGGVQVQRAGGQGFSHNEVNPDNSINRMIQLWALPTEAGQPAGYKYYEPKRGEVTRIYGGTQDQHHAFDNSTTIDIANLEAGQSINLTGETLVYITKGEATIQENNAQEVMTDGDLMRSRNASLTANENLSAIVISTTKHEPRG